MSLKQILVTGANDGIGLALAKQLTKDYGAKVFLGSRNATKGAKAVEDVKAQSNGNGDVELILIDVNSKDTITAAAESLKAKGIKLYGLVNNAGIGWSTEGVTDQDIIETNYFGTKRVTEAFMPLLEENARIVMTGSGAGPMTVRHMPPELQKKFCFPDFTILKELETKMQAGELKEYDTMSGYGVSKAMMHMYASALAKEYPQYLSFSVSPGYIATKLTAKYEGGLPVDEGTISLRHCLFEAKREESGWYFGSDGKRSPIHVTRDPGDPVFDGNYPF